MNLIITEDMYFNIIYDICRENNWKFQFDDLYEAGKLSFIKILYN